MLASSSALQTCPQAESGCPRLTSGEATDSACNSPCLLACLGLQSVYPQRLRACVPCVWSIGCVRSPLQARGRACLGSAKCNRGQCRGGLAAGVLWSSSMVVLPYTVDALPPNAPCSTENPRTKLSVPYRSAHQPSDNSVWAQPGGSCAPAIDESQQTSRHWPRQLLPPHARCHVHLTTRPAARPADTNITFTTLLYYNRGLRPDELLQALQASAAPAAASCVCVACSLCCRRWRAADCVPPQVAVQSVRSFTTNSVYDSLHSLNRA